MPGKCQFQQTWIEENQWCKWLRKKDKFTAFCCFCKKTFDVSHSGITAIKSHEKGKKHLQFVSNLLSGKQLTLHSFNPEVPITSAQIGLQSSSQHLNVGLGQSSSSMQVGQCLPSSSQDCSIVEPSTNRPKSGIESFLVKDNVTKSEILWSAFCVTNHVSSRAGASAIGLFPVMFRDSSVAEKIQMGKDKLAYGVTYGLGPYFANEVLDKVRSSPFYALSIDESLNEICQKQQLDVVANYWDVVQSRVDTRYLTSLFLQGATAIDLLDKVTACISDSKLSLENLIQLSTDGPNVNLKLIFDLKTHMKIHNKNNQEIVDVGTCSLHVVNNAYKTAHSKVDWKLNQFLRALYRLFKNYPSRRAVYRDITKSTLFPKKFCAIRWTENSGVIRRALDMLPHLQVYFKEIKDKPNTENFNIVKSFVQDPVLAAKLHFSAMVSEELEEFLTTFQCNSPLLPFLHQEVNNLMRNLAEKFIKKKILETATSASKLVNIDINNDENVLPVNKVDVGFGARASLQKVKEINIEKFKLDCRAFYVLMFKKLADKSPLGKKMVLGASCLNPTVMMNERLRVSRAQVAIEEFIKHSQISPAEGDIILREYKKLCENPSLLDLLNNFNWKKERLDTLFTNIFESIKLENVNKSLISFVQRILVCFHGNAAVERSFSFNKAFLVENLQEQSLVAQRSLHDHVNSLPDGLMSLNITKKMIHEYRNASSRRKEDLKRKREEESSAERARKQALLDKKELMKKKQKLEEEKQDIDKELKNVFKVLNRN